MCDFETCVCVCVSCPGLCTIGVMVGVCVCYPGLRTVGVVVGGGWGVSPRSAYNCVMVGMCVCVTQVCAQSVSSPSWTWWMKAQMPGTSWRTGCCHCVEVRRERGWGVNMCFLTYDLCVCVNMGFGFLTMLCVCKHFCCFVCVFSYDVCVWTCFYFWPCLWCVYVKMCVFSYGVCVCWGGGGGGDCWLNDWRPFTYFILRPMQTIDIIS